MRMLTLLLAIATVAATTAPALAADVSTSGRAFGARLSGYQEVHFIPTPTPALRGAISTPAHGAIVATIDDRAGVIRYELSYAGLAGQVTQAHIHFGQPHTVGGIVMWLCQTTLNPAPASVDSVTPVCPQEGTVTGTIEAAQVLSPAGQGTSRAPWRMS